MLNHWNNTNREYQQRISETQETLGKLTTHIHLVDKEIMETDGMIEQLRTAKRAKQVNRTKLFFSHMTITPS